MVTDVPRVPNEARLRAVASVRLQVVIILVRAGGLRDVRTVSCSLPHCHDHGNRFYEHAAGGRGFV